MNSTPFAIRSMSRHRSISEYASAPRTRPQRAVELHGRAYAVDRVDGIVGLAAGPWLLQSACFQPRVGAARQIHHPIAVCVVCVAGLLLVGRNAAGNDQDTVQRTRVRSFQRGLDMAAMDRIEGAAEERESHFAAPAPDAGGYAAGCCGA